MSKVFALPDVSIMEYVDGLLLNCDDSEPGVLNISKVNDFLRLSLHNYDFRKLKKEAAVGQQLELRGILDIKEKAVILDINESYHRRKIFSNGHEIGHYVLPHHKDILYQCSEEDMTQSVHDSIEREANLFSALLMFKGSSFTPYIRDYSTINSSLISTVSDAFDTSMTATCRRIVESTHLPVALVVLERGTDGIPEVVYTIASESMKKNYFSQIGSFENIDSLFGKGMNSTAHNPLVVNSNVQLGDERILDFHFEFFTNTFQVLGIITPVA